MKKSRFISLALVLSTLAVPALSHAQIINVQIGSQLYTGTGADPLAGNTWNLIGGGNQPDVAVTEDSSGNALTGVSTSVTAAGFFDFYGATNGNNLIDGYDYANSPSTVSITGLADNAPFTIYLYGTPSNATDGARETDFTLAADNGGDTGTVMSRLASESSTTFLPGFDYTVLTGLTNANGAISVTYSAPNEADLNGFQVNVGTPSVPEPSSWALMLAGFAGLVALGHRGKRA